MHKKIIISSNSAWSTYHFRADLIKRLLQEGYEVYSVSPKDDFIKKIEKIGAKVAVVDFDRKSSNFFSEAKLFLNYYKLYKKIKPGLVFHYSIKPNIYGSIAARLLRLNSIAVITGLGYVFLNDDLKSILGRFLYRFTGFCATYIFFLNEFDRKLFIKKKIVSASKTKILPGEGIDTEFYKATKKHNSGNKYDFLFIGRLLWDKGIAEFVEAAKIIKAKNHKVLFGILGEIDSNPASLGIEEINAWKKEGLITYLGASENVKEIVENSKCVVLPSYREGLPRVILEASSLEKIVIGTDVPGCRDVIDDDITGFLCKPKDSKSLANMMQKVMDLDQKRIDQIGRFGRKKVKNNFSNIEVYKRYKQILIDLKYE